MNDTADYMSKVFEKLGKELGEAFVENKEKTGYHQTKNKHNYMNKKGRRK